MYVRTWSITIILCVHYVYISYIVLYKTPYIYTWTECKYRHVRMCIIIYLIGQHTLCMNMHLTAAKCMSYRALQLLSHCVHVPQVTARDAVMAILLYEESLVDRFGMQSSCIVVCVCTRCTPACSVPCTCCPRCCGHTYCNITIYYILLQSSLCILRIWYEFVCVQATLC